MLSFNFPYLENFPFCHLIYLPAHFTLRICRDFQRTQKQTKNRKQTGELKTVKKFVLQHLYLNLHLHFINKLHFTIDQESKRKPATSRRTHRHTFSMLGNFVQNCELVRNDGVTKKNFQGIHQAPAAVASANVKLVLQQKAELQDDFCYRLKSAVGNLKCCLPRNQISAPRSNEVEG